MKLLRCSILPNPKAVMIFLPYLINQIAEIQDPFLIVLDDYHVITESKIHDLMLYP